MRLCQATLDRLPTAVVRPAYQPQQHGIGVVHLGLGAFHRAHQAVYFDDCLAFAGGNWRILAATLRSPTAPDALRAQDGLYTLAVENGKCATHRIIGAIADAMFVPREFDGVVDAIAAPTTRVVTLTVTEKGYGHVSATGALDMLQPGVAHDLTRSGVPRTMLGVLTEGLHRRRAIGGPLTVISCDNLAGNGALLRSVLIAFVERLDPTLARWVEDNVAFPSTMVDRIVPATTLARITDIEAQFGYRDEMLVATEPFTQWVIENRFATEMPDLATIGVRIVPDVRVFERAKLRMLNAAHSLLAYTGLLAGCVFVHEAVARADLREAARRLMLNEAAPSLELGGQFDAAGYAEMLLARFANGALAHRLEQIACDGSQKLPLRILPTIRASLARSGPIDAAALAVAGWIAVSVARVRQGRFSSVSDPLDAQLRNLLCSDADPVDALLSQQNIFADIATPDFLAAVRAAYSRLIAP